MYVSRLTWVLQRNRTHRIRRAWGHRRLTGVGRHRDGGCAILQCAVYKLENQKSTCYSSVRYQRPKNQEAAGLNPGAWGHRTRKSNVPGQKKIDISGQEKTKFTVPLLLCSTEALSRLDDTRPHWWGCISLLSLLTQMLISCRNTLRNNVLIAAWASLSKSQVDTLDFPSRINIYPVYMCVSALRIAQDQVLVQVQALQMITIMTLL